ncbi:YegS/Rv2252/BmrU family lipid kinase [Bacillus idriensis]|uniref:YegS/Rv2252/BmrU family lipid kinase n=2 Tax=Metabacillus idriensis TaxID=324768 RepID=A0A6I2MA81_9BACI|nr:YegS/Rv2252/BmrU family lipid kinase [Metabacillus idriensis]
MELRMKNSIYFIINPLAGNGRSLRVWKKVKAELERNQADYRSFLTEYSGHAEILARQIATIQDYHLKTVVGIGGDGTIHEIVNGLSEFHSVQIGFIPAGSGNDFKRGYNLSSKDPSSIFRRLQRQVNSFDLGQYHTGQMNRFFVNSMGAGFDAYVAKLSNEMELKKWLNKFRAGSFIYIAALLKGLFNYKPNSVTLTVDDTDYVFENVWLAAVSNHPFYGGGMKISPAAKPDDGVLDLIVVHNLSRLKLLLLFGLVFAGVHTRLKEVHTFTARKIKIAGAAPLMIHADGEYIGETPVTVTLRPKSIKYYT